jgi:hypothetical protein
VSALAAVIAERVRQGEGTDRSTRTVEETIRRLGLD